MFIPALVTGQENRGAGSREQATQLFHEGKFSEALPLFTKLFDDSPSDRLLCYFIGACKVETGDYTPATENYLKFAGEEEVPARLFYYFARYYHANQDWNNALRYYNRFRNNAPAAEVEALRITELSELCSSKINPFVPVAADSVTETNLPVAEVVTPETEAAPALPAPDTLKPTATTPVEAEPEKPVSEKPAVQLQFIEFQVNPQVTYLVTDFFQVPEAKAAFEQGRRKQLRLDSLLVSAESNRNDYARTANPAERQALAEKILAQEQESLLLKAEVDQLYFQARDKENAWWETADYSALEKFNHLTDSLKQLQRQQAAPPAEKPAAPAVAVPQVTPAEYFDQPAGPTPQPADADAGAVTYKIQIGSYSRGVPAYMKNLFDKLSKIRPIETYVDEKGVTVYTTGNVKKMEDAVVLQKQVRQEGIKDAFVVAFKDGKRISLQEAKNIEKP